MNKTEKRFWAKVDIKTEDECWEWKTGKDKDGYGKFNGGISHRYSWELCNKRRIPKGMLVLHKCDNPGCVNPRHLYVGTRSDNMKDMMNRKRGRCSKFSTNDLQEIRKLLALGESQDSIADAFKVSQKTIFNIAHSDGYPSKEGIYV